MPQRSSGRELYRITRCGTSMLSVLSAQRLLCSARRRWVLAANSAAIVICSTLCCGRSTEDRRAAFRHRRMGPDVAGRAFEASCKQILMFEFPERKFFRNSATSAPGQRTDCICCAYAHLNSDTENSRQLEIGARRRRSVQSASGSRPCALNPKSLEDTRPLLRARGSLTQVCHVIQFTTDNDC